MVSPHLPIDFDLVDDGLFAQAKQQFGRSTARQACATGTEPASLAVIARNDGDLRTDTEHVFVRLPELDCEPMILSALRAVDGRGTEHRSSNQIRTAIAVEVGD